MPPNDDAPPKHPFARHRDLLTALASGFVGALALATSTYNVYLQRQQVRAEVLPRLTAGTDLSNDGLSVMVVNRGVGPAEVKRVRVTVDGRRTTDWIDAVTTLLGKSSLPYMPIINQLEGDVMSPGLETTAMKIPNFRDSARILAQRRRMSIEVCYCSTLGDCWALTATGGEPSATHPVRDCAEDPKPFRSVSEGSMDNLLAAILRDDDAGGADAGAPDAR